MNETIQPIDNGLLLALQSDYLIEGYKQDYVELALFDYSLELCTGLFKVTEAYAPSDGKFHLSMTTVTNCISQIGIVYAGLLNGLKKKNSEVYVMEYNIRFLRPINELEFNVTAAMNRIKRKKDAIIYTMNGEVQQGAFSYEVTFLFPIAEML